MPIRSLLLKFSLVAALASPATFAQEPLPEPVRTGPLAEIIKAPLSLPVLPMAPVEATAFYDQARPEEVARLVRGPDVFELSNRAIYRSGLLKRAIDESPELATCYSYLHEQQLVYQAQEYYFMQADARWKARAQKVAHLQLNPDDPDAPNLKEQEDLLGQDGAVREQALSDMDQARTDRDVAFENFDRTLTREGVDGARVAAVTSAYDQRNTDEESLVLIRAVDEQPSNNLGYTYTKVYEDGSHGLTMVPSEYLLPLPVDSNDIFSPAVGTTYQRMPDGVAVKLSEDDKKNPVLRMLGLPRFGFYYDTGFVATGGNFAENVSLQGSDNSAAGQTFFLQQGTAVTPVDLILDGHILDAADHSVQAFVDANNDLDPERLDVETVGVRAYNRSVGSMFEGWSVAVGQFNTLFGAAVQKPAGFEGSRSLVGSVDRTGNQVKQIALHAPLSNYWTYRVAVEDPTRDGYNDVAGDTSLTRWPTLATNITWEDKNCNDLFQVGALMQTLGFQSAVAQEHFTTGWGLSGIAKVGNDQGAFFAGVAGGNGIGDYIQGVSFAAAAGPNSISPVAGLGAYLGDQLVWRDPYGKMMDEINIAYGYSLMDTPALLGPEVDRKLHQAWVNYAHFLSDYCAVGVEYQYGFREVASGDRGEDHRILFLVALRSGPTKQSTQPEGSTLIKGRTSEDVVRQYQRGGPAFKQSL